jgi:hypothetical protein
VIHPDLVIVMIMKSYVYFLLGKTIFVPNQYMMYVYFL